MDRFRNQLRKRGLYWVVSIGALALLSLTVASGPPEKSRERRTEAPLKPRLIVVQLHADWCRRCQDGASRLERVRTLLADDPVLFVRLDWTNERIKRQSEYLSAQLDMGRIWKEAEQRIGSLILVNSESMQEVGAVDLRGDETEIQKAILAKLE